METGDQGLEAMTSNLEPPASSLKPLASARCFLHPDREAAAVCLSCGRAFCRECVTEHQGRVLCSRCMALLAAGETSRRPLAWAGPAFLGAAGLLFAWIFFYYLGLALAYLPAAWHAAP